MTQAIMRPDGAIQVPNAVTSRYGFAPDVPIRVVETQGGILLVPLTSDPVSPDLEREITEWQAIAGETLEDYPYDERRP